MIDVCLFFLMDREFLRGRDCLVFYYFWYKVCIFREYLRDELKEGRRIGLLVFFWFYLMVRRVVVVVGFFFVNLIDINFLYVLNC